MANILSGVEFNINNDFKYTTAKVNARGGKSVGIINSKTNKSLHLSTPLMLTWGVNEYTDENTGANSYTLSLQFPNDEYNNPDCQAFLKNMQDLEKKIKDDAVVNSKEWLNKSKIVPEAVDALWSPMLKYQKDKDTGEPDYSKPPTLKVKIPYWEGVFKNVEIYDIDHNLLYPPNDDSTVTISDLIAKGSNVATLIQCGGLWVANGKFGVTWKLVQCLVKPRESLKGKCHILLSDKEREKLESSIQPEDEEDEVVDSKNTTAVVDSDDEDIKQEVKQEIESKVVATEDAPKKKKVVKKKAVVSA